MPAAVATGAYVPPFATASPAGVTQTATRVAGASLSFAHQGTLSGGKTSGTATAATTAAIVDSTGGVDSSSLLEYFTKPYIDAHTLSRPSWRYAYILWFFILFTLIIWSIAYHLSGRGTGTIGAWFRKWSIRRVVIGRPAKKAKNGEKSGNGRKRIWASPTIAQMLAVVGLIGLCVGLSLIGPDYISPTTCTFGGVCPYNEGANSGPPKSTYRAKRSLEEPRWRPAGPDNDSDPSSPPPPMSASMFYGIKKEKRGVNNPNGWAPFNDPLLAAPNRDVAANWWSAADRLGLISYAMFPMVVSLALKQWPFNLWASPFFTNYHFDKTAILHRWSGRVIWLFSSGHTAAWLYQLIQDKDPFGRIVLVPVFQYFRFIAGVAAYIALTLMMVLSFSPFRHRHYELFYWSHVLLVIICLVGCLIHTRPLSGWPISALALWGAERLARLAILVFINRLGWNWGASMGKNRGSGGSFAMMSGGEKGDLSSSLTAYPPKPYGQKEQGFGFGATSPLSPDRANTPFSEKDAAYQPSRHQQETEYLDQHHYPQPTTVGHDYTDPYSSSRSLPLGAAPPRPHSSSSYAMPDSLSSNYPPYQHTSHEQQQIRPQPGYSSAQILPGKMVRLTLNIPSAVRWRPGQHVFLTLPGVKMIQGHPYTITNVDERSEGIVPSGGRDLLKGDGTQMIFLIRAQKGFSRALWDSVVKARREKEAGGATGAEIAKGVEMRSLISWPIGSSGRVSWDDFESLLIIVGGTGVTFGLAVLEYACRRLARAAGASESGKRHKFKTQRVRFIWVLQQYAHVTWAAPTIRRCMEMCSPEQLQVNIFVSREDSRRIGLAPPRQREPRHTTQHAEEEEELAPPRRPFVRTASPSRDSVHSDWSDAESDVPDNPSRAFSTTDVESNIDSVTDLVLFEGEDDEISPAEAALSKQVRDQGKLRRARSRREQGHPKAPLRPRPNPRGSSFDALRPEHDISNRDAHSSSPPQMHSPGRSHFDRSDSFADMSFAGDDQSERFSMGGASSVRHLMRDSESRSGIATAESGDVTIDLTAQDQEDLDAVSELAKVGHPKLDLIMDEEIQRSAGRTMVACCGPTELNTLVRHLVSDRIDLRKVMKGDPRGQVSLVCEDFSF